MGSAHNKSEQRVGVVKDGIDFLSYFAITVMINRRWLRYYFGKNKYIQCGYFVDLPMSRLVFSFTGWIDYPVGHRLLDEHEGPVTAAVVSSDQSHLFTASFDGTIINWDLQTLTLRHQWLAHLRQVTCMDTCKDWLVSGSSEHTIRLWNVNSHDLIRTFCGHFERIRSVKFNKDGRYVVSGSQDCTIRVWSVYSNTCFKIIKCSKLNSGIVNVCDRNVISVGYDGLVVVYKQESGREMKSVKIVSNQPSIYDVGVSCDKKWVTCVTYNEIVVFSWPEMIEMHRLKEYCAVSCCFHPVHATWMAVGFHSGWVKIIDVMTGKCLRRFTKHSRDVRKLVFTSNGSRLVSCSSDYTARVWDISDLILRC